MSKINQIQDKLRELSGGAFQKLADAYLHRKGYEHINPLGSVIGSDKVRKGTPDTLVSLPNGKYIFAEHTTQKEDLYDKLKDDLDKCFDEKRTGVPVEKIQELIFCHTSLLTPAEENVLAEECQKRGVNFNIFGIGSLSYDLYQKYPGLARDSLGIEVDTGQVVSPEEFVAAYNRSALATPLDTAFHFREEEVKQVLQGLEESDLVIVSGHAGVGKSRLALESCSRFMAMYPDYTVRCVFNRYQQDLFEDLRVYFSGPGHYLICVDDANRVIRFDYFVRLLLDQRKDQRIKVIATVRDYALNKVRDAMQPYGSSTEVELQPLEESQIKRLVKDEYSIHNPLYLDRIADIAQGNPRLAIMAAQVARRENTLQSISDVSALYDEYYSSIRRDLEEFSNQDLLKAAGLVAFFRAIDRSNEKLMSDIEAAFSISAETFWAAVQQLHNLEVFDMYEDEVVRTSDQVLATYLFYLALFKTSLLDFSILLRRFFPHFKDRFIDALYPVIGAFDNEALVQTMRPHVDLAWKSLEEAGEEEALLHLMEVFWFIKETDTLLYVQARIAEIESESVDLSELKFEFDQNIGTLSLLHILSLFRYSKEETLRVVVGLVLDYLAKRPSELPKILYLLTDHFGFTHESYFWEFIVQRVVIDVLWEHAREGQNELFSLLFLAVAKQYLHTRFHTTEPKGRHTISVINFQLPAAPKLLELRQMIWDRMFQLYSISGLRDAVLGALHDYSMSGYMTSANEIVMHDSAQVLSFIESELSPTDYRHCLVAQDCLDFLESHDVTFDKELRNRFIHETYTLAHLLLDSRDEMRRFGLDHERYRRFKAEQIERYSSGFNLRDYEQFFERCLEIDSRLRQNRQEFQLQRGIVEALHILGDRDPNLYAEVMKYYLGLGDPLKLIPIFPLSKLVEVCGTEQAYAIVSKPDYPSKRRWLFDFHRLLPPGEVTLEHLNQLCSLYQEADLEELPQDMDLLLKYYPLDDKVIARVIEIILEKTEKSANYTYGFFSLLDPSTEIGKAPLDYLDGNLDLLKRAYFTADEMKEYADYHGQTFARILDVDPGFILEYIDRMYEKKGLLSRYHDTRDYTFLWRRDDCEVLMTQVVERVYEREHLGPLDTYLRAFLAVKEGTRDEAVIRARQDRFLMRTIERRYDNLDLMQFLFGIIADFPPERRRPFTALFLEHNKSFEDFRKLPLEPDSWSWLESEVPTLQKRVEYFESLLPLLNTVEFLQHKQYVERIIQRLRKEIEREKKRDFMED